MTEVTTPETAPEAAAPGGRRNLFKSVVGVFFMYGSRGVGLLFTLALIGKLSIADYGLYALAMTFATILGTTIDFPWNVRSMRESDEAFVRERASRFLLGATLMIAGAAIIPVSYFVWFGLVVAGGEILFNALKSRDSRDGHPDRVWRYDVIRQTTSVVLACGYLFAVDDPTLVVASLLYCAPYVVILVLAGFAVCGHRPAMPGKPRQIAILIGELGFGTALYLQGDVLLLGWLTDSTVVGYYNIAFMVATALAAVGQSFGMSYHEPLRKSGGDLSAGPKLRTTIGIATVVGLIVVGHRRRHAVHACTRTDVAGDDHHGGVLLPAHHHLRVPGGALRPAPRPPPVRRLDRPGSRQVRPAGRAGLARSRRGRGRDGHHGGRRRAAGGLRGSAVREAEVGGAHMTKVMFLLSKDPVLEHGGDVEMSRLMMGLAAEDFDVSAVCLSHESGTRWRTSYLAGFR